MAELVFDIYRDHWARENNKLRKLRYAKHFKEYFECSCSEEDILSLRLESSPEGLFEVLGYVKDWVLFPFGYTTDRWFSQVRNHQKFRLHAPTVPSRLTQLRDDAYYNSTAWLAKLDTIVLTKNVYVLAESTSLSNSVINNLISNSIKFVHRDSELRIEVKSLDDVVHIILSDKGIGIPKYLLKDIFNSNIKTTRTGTFGEVGTGFGMPLVKAFVEQYGGKISVESNDIKDHPNDHGTMISIVLKKAKKVVS